MNCDLVTLNKVIEQFVDEEIKNKTMPLFKKFGICVLNANYRQTRIDNVREQMFESISIVRSIMS